MSDFKFTQMVSKSGSDNIFVVTGSDNGSSRPAWWILEADKVKTVIIKNAHRQEQMDLANYGKILDSGFGAELPAEILAKYKS